MYLDNTFNCLKVIELGDEVGSLSFIFKNIDFYCFIFYRTLAGGINVPVQIPNGINEHSRKPGPSSRRK